jgi:hypothetical protein
MIVFVMSCFGLFWLVLTAISQTASVQTNGINASIAGRTCTETTKMLSVTGSMIRDIRHGEKTMAWGTRHGAKARGETWGSEWVAVEVAFALAWAAVIPALVLVLQYEAGVKSGPQIGCPHNRAPGHPVNIASAFAPPCT